MSKLTGSEISKRVADGRLTIKPFDERNVNPNSYNLTIGPKLLVYRPRSWFTPWRKPLAWGQFNTPDYVIKMDAKVGFVIKPGWFYLGSVIEYTKTPDLVPILDGRSSSGRLSLHIHATAGFGDIGFEGCWTLEIYSIIPVRIFPFTQICQISYELPEGEIVPYTGKYGGYDVPVSYQPSRNGKFE